MEQSEIQKKIINLGEKFVKELGIEDSVDTLSRWMAHFLAELMVKSQNSTGLEKERLDKECFDCILSLWKHRWTLPHGSRPLENFAPLLNLLQKLNPEKDEPYFYPKIPQLDQDERTEKNQNRIDWIKMAESIDKIARIWLDEVFCQAAKSEEKPETKSWLENAVVMPQDHDRQIIVKFLSEEMSDIDDIEETQERITRKKVEERIRQLEGFTVLNNLIIDLYVRKLK